VNIEEEPKHDRAVTGILLALLLFVPLLPNPGLFTGYDLPKWALLTAGLLAALGILFYRAFASKASTRVSMPEHLSLLSLLVIAAFFIAKRAPDGRATALVLAEIGMLSAFGILVVRFLRDGDPAERALMAVAVAGAAGAVIGIAGVAPVTPWTVAGTFGNASFAAEFIAPASLVATALFFLGRRRLAVLTALPMLLFLVLSKSRADWLGLICGAVLLVVLELRTRGKLKLSARALTIIILVGVIALPYLIQVLPLPVFGRSDTVRVRELVRASTIEMAKDHWVTGVGLDGFTAAYPEYRSAEEFTISKRRGVTFPHNLPLQVLAETGVPGLMCLLLFLYVTIIAGLRTLDQSPDDGIAFGALGALVAIFVSAQLSAPLRHPASALLFFLLSALLVGRRPRHYVAQLSARYRRAVPVFILLVPTLAAAYLLGPLLLADLPLKNARDRIAVNDGGMDDEVAEMLEDSIGWRPTADALRMLAYYRTGTDEPEKALALTERLFSLEPHHQLGKLERGRALVATGRAEEALRLLEPLIAKRPGDPVLNGIRAKALMESLKTASLEDVTKRAGALSRQAPQLALGMIRMAERIGEEDMVRGLAILHAVGDAEAVFYQVILLAKHGELSEAMNRLWEANKQGSLTQDRLDNHPGLDPLRGRADFRTLRERR